jgi:hypothetical protein
MYKKQKVERKLIDLLLLSSALPSSRTAILFILLIFSFSLSIITTLYISQHQQAMAQTNITTTPSQATNNTEQNAFLTYENTTYGIRIQYPAGWQEGESNQTSEDSVLNYIVAFRSPKDRISDTVAENVIVSVENLPPEQNISLAAYSTRQIADLTQFSPDFDLQQSIPTVLAGIPAHKVVFSETVQQQQTIKVMQVWTIKDNKAYIIAFAGEPAKYSYYLPTVEKMIDSFEFINSTRGANNSTAQSSTTTTNQ